MPLKENTLILYKNPYFLETGSYLGDGIEKAISAGFQTIISIELSQKYFELCTKKFSMNSNVKIILGDSSLMLSDVIKNIDVPITFWLDGHHSCGDTALGNKWSPLIEELIIIKEHPIKTHIILIDDMRCWKKENPVIGFGHTEIVNVIMEINNKYKIEYIDGCEQNDILAARIG